MACLLSVVIVAKNRIQTLPSVLQCLAQQTSTVGDWEVLVVDDGSTDGTAEFLRRAEYPFRIRHEHLPARELFCPARPRNCGISLASGDLMLFLDGDFLAARNLIESHLKAHASASRPLAVIGMTCGYTSELDQRTEDFPVATPDELVEQVDELSAPSSPAWQDSREAIFARTHDLKDHFTPWRFFWGNNVSIPRNSLLELGGFDEQFTGYGGEDIELGYRLFLHGVEFHVARDARGLHYPHSIGPVAERQGALMRNRRRLLAKHASTELEAQLWAGQDGKWVWERIKPLTQQLPPPEWARLDREGIANRLCLERGGPRRYVWFGSGCAPELGGVDDCCPFSRPVLHPAGNVLPLVGLFTPWEDQAYDGAFLCDYWRWLPIPILKGVLREGLRIARQVFLIDSGAKPQNPDGLRIHSHEACLGAVEELNPVVGCELLRDPDVVAYRLKH